MKNPIKLAKLRRPSAPTTTPLNIRKILAPTDFSDASRQGINHAISLADKLGSTVALFHVVEPRSWLSDLGSTGLFREDSAVVASARAQLARLAKGEGQGAVTVSFSVTVCTGSPFHAITTAALEQAADLIVLASHGHTGGARILLGSTAERVVSYAPCPVLIVPARTKARRIGQTPGFRLRKILVPLDFSKLSEAVLPWVGLLSARFGVEIVLLHVVERFPIDHVLVRDMTGEAFAPFTKTARTNLQQLARSLGKSTGTNVSALVRHGKPFERICQTARSLGADLIVLSTHGHTGLKHVLLGSTAERVIRHSLCPVLAVRELTRKPR